MMKNSQGSGRWFSIYNLPGWVLFMLLPLGILMTCSCSKGQDARCSDPFALNYDPGNPKSGKCEYPTIYKTPALVTNLVNGVRETSGLAYQFNHLITHNDKGGENELYVLNTTTGQVEATITVSNALNNDWEDLASSGDHLYIGDFGNNDGDRQNLTIYKMESGHFVDAIDKSVPAVSQIGFTYPEQKSFKSGSKHNFDCEAFVYLEGNLYLFTKNRTNGFTNLYRVPDRPGVHAADLMDSFEAEVMITGAALNKNTRTLALLGYNKDRDCVVWLFEGYEHDQFFKSSKKQIILGAFSDLGQMEGIDFRDDHSVWISSERTSTLPPRLYVLDLN